MLITAAYSDIGFRRVSDIYRLYLRHRYVKCYNILAADFKPLRLRSYTLIEFLPSTQGVGKIRF